MEIRVHKAECEKGEFSLSKSCEYDEFQTIFSVLTQKVHYEHSFTIANPQIAFYLSNIKGQFLFVKHIAKDGYSLLFIDSIKKEVYATNIYEDKALKIASMFFENNYELLIQGMRKEEFKESLIDEFNYGNFLYTFRLWEHRIILIFELMISITTPFLLFFFMNDSPILINIFFSSIYPCAFIVQLIFLFNYLKEGKRIYINVSKCNPRIECALDGNIFSFLKSEVRELTIIHHSSLKSFGFGVYSFSRIVLIDGSIINIPDMVIDPYQLSEKFHGISVNWKNVNFPYIKLKSKLYPANSKACCN